MATDWYPIDLFTGVGRGTGKSHDFALIILNQPLDDLETLKALWCAATYRVAADGGANRLVQARKQLAGEEKASNGLSNGHAVSGNDFSKLDVIIGDLDSVVKETVAEFPEAQVIHDPDQYSTDFGKAITFTRASHDRVLDIVAMGSLAGRVDQGLSQLHHLYIFQKDPSYSQGRLYLVSNESLTFLLKSGSHRIVVRDQGRKDMFDKYVGIIPIKEPSVITTKGLEWDVEDWETEFGGKISTSNHVLPETQVVEVETSKDVVFTIALKSKR